MIAQDLRPAMRFTPRWLDATRIGGRAIFAPLFAERSAPNSDFYPRLDLGAERARFTHANANGIADLNVQNFDFVSALNGRRVPFDNETLVPIPSIPRPRALAAGAVLRRRRVANAEDSASGTEVVGALVRRARFENGLAAGRPPADWRWWMGDALEVSSDLHGGTAGVVDEEFYRGVFAYLAAQHAPAGARQSFAFQRALWGHDFVAAAALADSLLPGAVAGLTWYPLDDLRDGGTIAKLALGDAKAAGSYWRALAPRSGRQPGDVRSLLIGAYVITATQGKRAPATAVVPHL